MEGAVFMDYLQIVLDNEVATNNSFMYYLHERDMFEYKQFDILCNAITCLANSPILKEDKTIVHKVHFIHSQILSHILYHFNPKDGYVIKNLPLDFYENIESLDYAVHMFFHND